MSPNCSYYLRFPLLVLLALGLTACAQFRDILPWLDNEPEGPQLQILQRSDYCGTPDERAGLHYFRTPERFGAWIKERDIREFRSGAASLGPVIVVEMGRRPTAGYRLAVRQHASRIEDETLVLALYWLPPDPDAVNAQVVTAPCMVLRAPEGDYDRIVAQDQTLEPKASTWR